MNEVNTLIGVFRNNDDAGFLITLDMDTLNDEMTSLDTELDKTAASHKKAIGTIDSERQSISIYSLSFNKDLESLSAKSDDIDTKPIRDLLRQLNEQVDLVNSKLGELNQTVDKRNELHKSLSEKEHRLSQILAKQSEIAPL